MLEQCCGHSKQCRNNIATLCWAKNHHCESSHVTLPMVIYLILLFIPIWPDVAALVILSLGPVVENPTSLGAKAH